MAADAGSGNGSNIVVGPTRSFARPEQTFPTLTDAEIARMRRFGELMTYRDGELLFETGKPGRGMFVVLSGHVAITERDGLGHVTPIVEQGAGQFIAEVGQLSGRVALVDGRAEGDVERRPPEEGDHGQGEHERREGEQDVGEAHEDRLNPAPVEAGDEADDPAHDEAEEDREEANNEGDP